MAVAMRVEAAAVATATESDMLALRKVTLLRETIQIKYLDVI